MDQSYVIYAHSGTNGTCYFIGPHYSTFCGTWKQSLAYSFVHSFCFTFFPSDEFGLNLLFNLKRTICISKLCNNYWSYACLQENNNLPSCNVRQAVKKKPVILSNVCTNYTQKSVQWECVMQY